MLSGYDISPESCHLLLIHYFSPLCRSFDLHNKVVAISVLSNVGILTFGRECFIQCAMEAKLFRPIGNSTEIFVICGRKLSAHVKDGHITSSSGYREQPRD